MAQIACDAMRKQGLDESRAAEEWNDLRRHLDQAYLVVINHDPTRIQQGVLHEFQRFKV